MDFWPQMRSFDGRRKSVATERGARCVCGGAAAARTSDTVADAETGTEVIALSSLLRAAPREPFEAGFLRRDTDSSFRCTGDRNACWSRKKDRGVRRLATDR